MKQFISQSAAALLAGVVFGLGLAVSGMLDPARVKAFLDIFGHWDPSLAFVLGGAVLVAFIGVRIMHRLPRPAFDPSFHLPAPGPIDRPLVLGSALFGMGWGIAGLCPGPAIASLVMGHFETLLFVIAMLVGMIIHDRGWKRKTR